MSDYTDYYPTSNHTGKPRLCREQTRAETVWSSSIPVPYRQIRKQFGLSDGEEGAFSAWLSDKDRHPEDRDEPARLFAALMLIVANLPVWLSPGMTTGEGVMVCLLALGWICFSGRFKNDEDYEDERDMTFFGFFFIVLIAAIFNYAAGADDGDDGYSSGSGYRSYTGGHK